MPELLANPYESVDWERVTRRKAQFHAHSSHPSTEKHSGSEPPDEVIDAYAEAGYAALALTDHEYTVETSNWPWERWDRNPADSGMVGVEGVELGGPDDQIPHDTLSLFNDLADSTDMTVDDALDAIAERGGAAIFAHPGRYHDASDVDWYAERFEAHPNLLGLEVVNATDRYSTDREVWDAVQSRIGNRRAVWGFANDDYHGRETGYGFDHAYNVLLLPEVTEAAVRAAVEEGRFYWQFVPEGGSPPSIDAIRHDRDRGTLRVVAADCDAEWIADGEVVDRGDSVRYRDLPDGVEYVRARLVTPEGSESSTQPFLLG
ncbi:PHP domain-containing protein [Haladaptatus salinisoli]|uniref:PHP domain-containing protein n=1 Tax=Haladaptatus salinisoli TaxID=2884876 RepID=UPI001D0B7F76|nr:hypothetical protein [Haladaptatus salinisoli]